MPSKSTDKPTAKPTAKPSAADTIRAKRKAAADKAVSTFKAHRDAERSVTAQHYAGLSQAVHRSGGQRPIAYYLQSYFSGNGHAPNSLTQRDESAALALARAGSFKAGASVNPGTFGGDKSACGIRARGHGFIIATDAAGKPTDSADNATGLAITDFCVTTAKRLQ